MRSVLFSLVVLLLVSCAPEFEKENPGLANRGILPLSVTDPFLGANVFLSRQMEQSPHLHNFLKTRGGPLAIQLKVESGEAPELIMYYPKTKEVYAAERHLRKVAGQKQPVADWVVRGPYAIERVDYRELGPMDAATVGEPVFYVWGRQVRFNRASGATLPLDAKKPDRTISPVLPPTPPTTPRPTPKPIKRGTPAPTVDPDAALIRDFKPLNSDQQALMMAKGYAERSDNGDVIHTVRTPNETLSEIANWFAGSAAQADEVASYNGLASKAANLVPGQRIRIPLRILKKVKAMP